MVIENKIRNTLLELGMAPDAFSIIADVTKTRLSRAFRGLQDFTGPEAETLLKIAEDLRQIQQDCLPFPISFATKDAMAIRGLLNQRRGGLRWLLRVEELGAGADASSKQ